MRRSWSCRGWSSIVLAALGCAAAVAVSGTGADAWDGGPPGSVGVLRLAADGEADPDPATGVAEPGDPAPSGEEPDPADVTVPDDAPIDDDEVAPDDEVVPDDGEDVDAEDEDVDAEDEETRPAPGPTVPAVRSSTIPLGSILLAVAVLLVGVIALTRQAKRPPKHRQEASAPTLPLRDATAMTDTGDGAELPAAPPPSAPPPPSATPSLSRPIPGVSEVEQVDPGTLQLLVEAGRALIDSGYAVGNVHDVLQRIAVAHGAPRVGIMVLPTALIVSIPDGGSVQTEVTPAGQEGLRLDQVDEVVRVATAAEEGQLTPAEGTAAIAAARERPPPRSDRVRLGGYVLLTVGLAMLLRGGVLELVVATGLGIAVGSLQLASHRLRGSYQPVLPVVAAFAVAAVVFGLGRLLPELAVFPPLVAPLIAFLPGAVLTTAVFELSTGHVISGSGRLAAGMLRLVLLALGIIAAAQLLGVPAAQVTEATSTAVSVLEPWVGVAVFGIGMVVFHGVRRASLPWILVVLYVAYAGQVLGGLFFGATLSAFFGALAMTPVAMVAARQEHGPPALVSFMPGFWLLVPGALGLAGITSFLDEDRLQGIDSLVTMGTSMVGIALGVLLGLVVGGELTAKLLPGPRPDDRAAV